MTRKTPTPVPTDDLDFNIESFSIALQSEGKARKTIIIYQTAAFAFARYLRANGLPIAVASIERTHVEAFLASLREPQPRSGKPYGEATRNQYYRSLQALFKYLSAEGDGMIDASPMRNMTPPKITDNPPAVLTDDQLNSVFRVCEGTSFEDRRDNAILRLFADSGIRLAELTHIATTDIDLPYLRVTVTGKFGRTRQPRYGTRTARAIDRYLQLRRKHPYAADPALWLGQRGPMTENGVYQMVERRARQAGLADARVHPHAFRAAFANNFLATGGQEGDLMQMAGWRSRSMIDRYARSAAAHRAAGNFNGHSLVDRLAKG